tara:strand:- start:164 stop:568 length:405 start_codon:yes stop_codon:yes gene_type:complete
MTLVSLIALLVIVASADRDDCKKTEGRRTVKEVFALTKTDKLVRHGYHRHYEEIFSDMREKNVRLLEIGVLNEKSLYAWKMIFPCAELSAGITYRKNSSVNATRVDVVGASIFYGSQVDESFKRCDETTELQTL